MSEEDTAENPDIHYLPVNARKSGGSHGRPRSKRHAQERNAPAGIWAIVDLGSSSENISIVFATEIDALRALNVRGHGRVEFVPFGLSLTAAMMRGD
jgi:hypothetical protein